MGLFRFLKNHFANFWRFSDRMLTDRDYFWRNFWRYQYLKAFFGHNDRSACDGMPLNSGCDCSHQHHDDLSLNHYDHIADCDYDYNCGRGHDYDYGQGCYDDYDYGQGCYDDYDYGHDSYDDFDYGHDDFV